MEVEISGGDAKAIFQHVGEEEGEVFVFREQGSEAEARREGKSSRRVKGFAPRDGP